MLPEHSDEDGENTIPSEISNEHHETQRDASEETRLISHTLSTLPNEVSRAFLLHRRDEMGFDQIAAQLDISPKIVEAHIAKALKEIRKILG